jgi:hypothetical protein
MNEQTGKVKQVRTCRYHHAEMHEARIKRASCLVQVGGSNSFCVYYASFAITLQSNCDRADATLASTSRAAATQFSKSTGLNDLLIS